MNPLLIKILAVGLTLSQLFTKPPEQVQLSFDPEKDQAKVEQHLRDGCGFILKKADEADIPLEMLIKIAKANVDANPVPAPAPSAPTPAPNIADETVVPPPPPPPAPASPAEDKAKGLGERLTKGIDLGLLLNVYAHYCQGQPADVSAVKWPEIIKYFNENMKDLPDVNTLKGMKLEETAVVLDSTGQRFSEIYSANNRRIFVPISQIPEHVRKAFVAAEDQDFYKHIGLDPFGVLRAFQSVSEKNRPQGGSTITQQVIKNLLLNDDLTFERKMREMVLATRLEKVLNKDQILELYLNFVFLGRSSWGVEMASRSYFGKSVKDLNPSEGALLAALTKGPNYYDPDKYPDRATQRRQYVLGRMKTDGYINDPVLQASSTAPLGLKPFESPRAQGAFYFLDAIRREAKEKGLLGKAITVRSTLNPALQKLTDQAKLAGLVEYENKAGRATFDGAQGSIADEIAKYGAPWQDILPKVKPRLYDIPWTVATVLRTGDRAVVGLSDGRQANLQGPSSALRRLKVYDLIFVDVTEGKKPSARLKIPPTVQAAVVVMEWQTGRVLAMSGGSSYAASQLNRVLDSERQPGSTLKPFTYLAALNLKFQPNTLIPDVPMTLPPIERGGKYFSPKNYDNQSHGLVTMRQAIEQSLNMATVRMMTELGQTPMQGLDYIQGITQELGIYKKADRYYPFVLGAQPARPIDLALAYATIAGDGLRPSAHFIESIDEGGRVTDFQPTFTRQQIQSVDRVSFYQMRRILGGTVVRGTAAKLKDLEGYVAGKTGTSNNENDAWFVGFTSHLVVAVWVGYDSRHIRKSLGDRFTGGHVALPIAEKIIRGSFEVFKPMELLPPPPKEIQPKIADYGIDLITGTFNGSFKEIFRRNDAGTHIIDTNRRILRGQETYMAYGSPQEDDDQVAQAPYDDQDYDPWRGRRQVYNPNDYYQPGAADPYEMSRRRQRRVDPWFSRSPYYNPFGGYP